MSSAEVARYEPTGIAPVDVAVKTWGQAPSLPAQFRDKTTGAAKLGDLVLACVYLDALNVDPRANLPDVYVIAGRVGLMAELQRALAARAGWDVEVTDSTATRAVVRIGRADKWKPDVTVTIEDARRAGWTKRNPNYETMPDRMLAARASTKAIGLYASGVTRGIDDRTSGVALAWDDDEISGPEPDRLASAQPGPEPAPTSAPQPGPGPASDRQRLALRTLLGTLSPAVQATVMADWRKLELPPLAHDDFSSDDATVALDLVLDQIARIPPPASVAVAGSDRATAAGGEMPMPPAGGTPPEVHDDAIEANSETGYEDPDEDVF